MKCSICNKAEYRPSEFPREIYTDYNINRAGSTSEFAMNESDAWYREATDTFEHLGCNGRF